MSRIVTITKVDEMTKPVPKVETSVAGNKKTQKTFPRGILKSMKNKFSLKPVTDPSKAPPLKKFMKKHTIRLLTDKGVRHQRKTIRHKISKMSDEKVKHLVKKAGLLKNDTTPINMMREMLEGGMIAGFISSD